MHEPQGGLERKQGKMPGELCMLFELKSLIEAWVHPLVSHFLNKLTDAL